MYVLEYQLKYDVNVFTGMRFTRISWQFHCLGSPWKTLNSSCGSLCYNVCILNRISKVLGNPGQHPYPAVLLSHKQVKSMTVYCVEQTMVVSC